LRQDETQCTRDRIFGWWRNFVKLTKRYIGVLLVCGLLLTAQAQQAMKPNAPAVLERNVRAHLEFLASDALQGRGSGTRDELIGGRYIASQLRQFGIEPAGDNGDYIQTVNIGARQQFSAAPKLTATVDGKVTEWMHGKEIIVWRMGRPAVSGPLQKLGADEKAKAGAVVFTTFPAGLSQREYSQKISALVRQGVAAVLTPENEQVKENRAALSANTPSFTSFSDDFKDGAGPPANFNVVFLGEETAKALQAMADGVTLSLGGPLAPAETRQTWNVIGVQKGSNPTGDAIILSAHMDHLGAQQTAPGEDKIFNGADDDASGCVAVLELARALGAGPQPKRTIYYVFFGSEEAGGYGARYFLKKPPVPIEKMAANLQFEMIGRPDAKVKPEELWLTGYERSNLGPELAKQGAKLVPDPHPDQQFFMRSDNYALARMGVVAHTVSSFGLHKEYHQANDDIAHIDFKHMTQAINSLAAPVVWLVNSDFRPTWVEGKKP
jgi:hypothetical protein